MTGSENNLFLLLLLVGTVLVLNVFLKPRLKVYGIPSLVVFLLLGISMIPRAEIFLIILEKGIGSWNMGGAGRAVHHHGHRIAGQLSCGIPYTEKDADMTGTIRYPTFEVIPSISYRVISSGCSLIGSERSRTLIL